MSSGDCFGTPLSLFVIRASVLASEVSRDVRDLTIHDITHADALWLIADLLIGPEYPLSPLEAYVLGGAFLLHDIGMALAAYSGGLPELKETDAWKNAVAKEVRQHFGRPPLPEDIANLDPNVAEAAKEHALRMLHAERAPFLATTPFQHHPGDEVYYLIENTDIRQTYGDLLGQVAFSHWWPISELQERLSTPLGAFLGCPADWKIDPLKLSCILRVADACHLDAGRARGFLRSLRKPVGTADLHWRVQGACRRRMLRTLKCSSPLGSRSPPTKLTCGGRGTNW